MEEWKLLDWNSTIFQIPAAALNLTAERWLLEPFPDGLVATNLSWDALNTTTRNYYQRQLDSRVIYPCSGNFCSSERSCRFVDDSCFVPVGGIGATTLGPAAIGIVPITHGIVAAFVFIVTLAVVMGCGFSTPYAPDDIGRTRAVSGAGSQPRTTNRRGPDDYPLRSPESSRIPALDQDRQVATYYARPPREPAQRHVEVDWMSAVPASEAEKARNITRLTEQLREAYALDLKAWSMEGVSLRGADRAELLRLRAESKRGLNEVAFIVGQWQAAANRRWMGTWTAEEKKLLDAMCATVAEGLPQACQ